MKKRIISIVLVIVLALSLCVPAMAAATENVAITYRAIKIVLNGKEISGNFVAFADMLDNNTIDIVLG